MSETEAEALVARHGAVFAQSPFKRLRGPLIAAGICAYLAFAWWFFAIGQVLSDGNWDIAGNYLADWISYEARPDIEYGDGFLDVVFPRFSPLGTDPQPDWLTRERATVERPNPAAADRSESADNAPSGGGFMNTGDEPASGSAGGDSFMAPGNDAAAGGETPAPDAGAAEPQTIREEADIAVEASFGRGKRVRVEPGLVTLTRGGETVVLDIERDVAVTPRGPLPDWASQRAPGSKVIAHFGFAGRAAIESDEVKVRRRFLGWENFFFDTHSPFWGRSAGEVFGLILSGPRLEPDRSNLALAIDNIVNNSSWQHGDVWIKLLQTIVMAFAGTVFATLLAFPMAFAAARNITPNRLVNQVLKRFFDFLRSVDMLIWALFFTRAFGPGPLAGISAIFLTDTGTFGKLYSESLENIDDKQREGVRSVGASPVSVQRYGVVPQVLPVFLSQSLYFWESNTRSATIIGAVGAGGIGLKLWEAMRTNQDWENVAYMVILILIVVFVFDNISSALRQRLIGRPG